MSWTRGEEKERTPWQRYLDSESGTGMLAYSFELKLLDMMKVPVVNDERILYKSEIQKDVTNIPWVTKQYDWETEPKKLWHAFWIDGSYAMAAYKNWEENKSKPRVYLSQFGEQLGEDTVYVYRYIAPAGQDSFDVILGQDLKRIDEILKAVYKIEPKEEVVELQAGRTDRNSHLV